MRGFSLTCDHCGHTKETWGPWAFSCDKHGRRVRFSSRAAGKRVVQGHESRQYCYGCRKTRLVITPYPPIGKRIVQSVVASILPITLVKMKWSCVQSVNADT